MNARRAPALLHAKRALGALLVLFAMTPPLRAQDTSISTEMSQVSTPAATDAAPVPQDLLFYNARIALRHNAPKDTLRLWLLRNALKDQGQPPTHDADFGSAVWAALGQAGLCQDGFPIDDDGAGLWPLALHNWLLKASARPDPASQPRTYGSFAAGLQQRRVSLNDVLSHDEMKSLRLYSGKCWMQYKTLLRLDTLHWVDLNDRLSVGIMLRDLLVLALKTLHKDKVQADVLLQTRLFDLELALTKLAASRERQKSGWLETIAHSSGVSEVGTQLMRSRRLEAFYASKRAEMLTHALTWSATSWSSLSQGRRIALFDESHKNHPGHPDVTTALLRLTDAAVSKGDGVEVEHWLSYATDDPALRDAFALGARGQRLLVMELLTGFRERGAIALTRGVDQLKRGDQTEALRSFAYALSQSDDSKDAEAVHRLAKRWLTFVLAQYQTSDAVLAVLGEFLAPVDYNDAVSVLLWRAAFSADGVSFDRIAKSSPKNGAPVAQQLGVLGRTVAQLKPLAAGDAGLMLRTLEREMQGEPHGVYMFVKRMTEELALEPLDVRHNHAVTLELSQLLLKRIAIKAPTALQNKIEKLRQTIVQLQDGVQAFERSVQERAKTLRPDDESYAGSIRLAPADALPWPFIRRDDRAPSPFTPIQLTPVEWRNTDGALVWGWSVHE